MGSVTTDEKIVDGEFKDTALAVVESTPTVALSTNDPQVFIDRAVKQADALKAIIVAKKLSVQIGGPGGKPHVLIDGWETLMALNGVMPHTVDLKRSFCEAKTCPFPNCAGGKLTVQATTELRRVQDQLVLTRVEAECSQHEQRWSKADHYAVTSMAQTRGVGKGCRQLYGWVMALAGYNSTPAEEMPGAPGPRPARSTSSHTTETAVGSAVPAAVSTSPAEPIPEGMARCPVCRKVAKPVAEQDRAAIATMYRTIFEMKPGGDPKRQEFLKAWSDFMDKGPVKWSHLWAHDEYVDAAMKLMDIERTKPEQARFDPDDIPT